MRKFTCFIHNHTKTEWKYKATKCGIGRVYHFGVVIRDRFLVFGKTKEDMHNALIVSQAKRLLAHTQEFFDHIEEGLIKDQVRKTLEDVKCFNYQQDAKS